MSQHAADDGAHACQQFVHVARAGQEIVSAEVEGLHPDAGGGDIGEGQHRHHHAGGAHASDQFVPGDVGQVEIEQNDVVLVEAKELHRLLARGDMLGADAVLTDDFGISGTTKRFFTDMQDQHRLAPLARYHGETIEVAVVTKSAIGINTGAFGLVPAA